MRPAASYRDLVDQIDQHCASLHFIMKRLYSDGTRPLAHDIGQAVQTLRSVRDALEEELENL